MKRITCTTCDKRAIEIPRGVRANSRVICRDCGAVHGDCEQNSAAGLADQCQVFYPQLRELRREGTP